ncbi:TraR/DksA C4-type zinc finger protein [Vibrio sp. Of7-15]|uniref:TraR/DksA C4-type zinc finger protein n=1 Tax=Vibrio sp. Of7-15 TaxID=2724879 RepID=UPI001EF22AEB|nr:TraR/DksA C4-type zinc finger protein [Vibrio sp. Of7-15]MCG7499372.1 TraR/DksA C4-type zinc finger protein [Vibrio sp. Of7-15]
MDVLDRASEIEAKQRQMAIARHRKNQVPSSQTSAKTCQECDVAIPVKRQELVPGCQHCARCQSLIEQGAL